MRLILLSVKATGDDVPATTDPVANAKALDKAEADNGSRA